MRAEQLNAVLKNTGSLIWIAVLIIKQLKLRWLMSNEWGVATLKVYKRIFLAVCRQRPYHVESTGSRPITEVKQRRARLVLGWVTAWEHRVLLATFFPFSSLFFSFFFSSFFSFFFFSRFLFFLFFLFFLSLFLWYSDWFIFLIQGCFSVSVSLSVSLSLSSNPCKIRFSSSTEFSVSVSPGTTVFF